MTAHMPQDDTGRAAHLRRLTAAWRAELRTLGPSPRRLHDRRGRRIHYTDRSLPWQHIRAAISGALDLAQALDVLVQQQRARMDGAA